LSNTIRIRNDKITIRLSDVLEEASFDILSSLIILLGCKLLRIKPPAGYRKNYQTYIQQPEVQQRADLVKKQRGTKKMLPAQGSVFDLDDLYQDD
jgi:hypothetical protein